MPMRVATTSRKTALGNSGVVKSAARVLHILEFFDRRRAAAKVQAVADELGYPASSTAALLRSLAAMGYLYYDRHSRTFAPTLRVTLLGSGWAAPRLLGAGALQRMMVTLTDRSHGVAALVSRAGDAAEVIHRLGTRRAGMMVGDRFSLLEAGPGRAMLAALADQEMRGLVHRLSAGSGACPTLCAHDVLREVAVARATGVASILQDELGIVAAPLPLYEQGGPYVVALATSALSFPAREKELSRMLKEEIARYFGSMAPAVLRAEDASDFVTLRQHRAA